MRNHDIPTQPILSTDDEGLDHNGILHSFDCECVQCTAYYNLSNIALDAFLAPCDPDGCQGCPKCPEVPMAAIFTAFEPVDVFDFLDLTEAQAFEQDFDLFSSFTRPLTLEPAPALPAMLERSDGATIFYDGKLNSLFGEAGGGKSWIAAITAIGKVRAGGRCVWWDFEDSANTLSARLQTLDALDVLESGRLKFVTPAMQAYPAAILQAADWLSKGDVPGMLVIDSVESAGCATDSNNVGPWFQANVDPWLAYGVGVLLLDHVAKRKEDRPRGAIGSQHKLARISGSALYCSGQAWTKQADGRIILRLHKDRAGDVPGVLGKPVAAINGRYANGVLTYSITAPDADDVDTGELSDQLLHAILETGDDGVVGGRAIRGLVKGKGQDIDNALSELIANGLVERVKVGQAYRYSVTIEGMSAD